MKPFAKPIDQLSNEELLAQLHTLLKRSRKTLAALLLHLAEVDVRRLHLLLGKSSLFRYCTDELGFSDAEAYLRIRAARMVRQFPLVLDYLKDGRLHLSGLATLAPHLTAENCGELLKRAAKKSKQQIAELVSDLRPKPAVPDAVRRLPCARNKARQYDLATRRANQDQTRTEPARSHSQDAPCTVVHPTPSLTTRSRAVVEPLGETRYKVSFTADRAFLGTLERAKALLSHRNPSGDLKTIFQLALTKLCDQLEKQRFRSVRKRTGGPHKTTDAKAVAAVNGDHTGDTKAPTGQLRLDAVDASSVAKSPGTKAQSRSRYIPKAVRAAVWERDGGRCAFVGRNGVRCGERHFLEFHHRDPYSCGGPATVRNLILFCRAHNQLVAWEELGPQRIKPAGRRNRAGSCTTPPR